MGFLAPTSKPDKASELGRQRQEDFWDLLVFQFNGKSEEPFVSCTFLREPIKRIEKE